MTIYAHNNASTLLPQLIAHLPSSLPLVLRLQGSRRFGSSHFLASFGPGKEGEELPRVWTAACVEHSHTLLTECWAYSSLEALSSTPTGDEKVVLEKDILEILEYAKSRRPRDIDNAKGFLVGSAHDMIAGVLEANMKITYRGSWNKYLFHARDVNVPLPLCLPEGYSLGEVSTGAQMERVCVNSTVRRSPDFMWTCRNSAVIYKGEPIAWLFRSIDGSLIALWVEEEHRGKGLGKVLTGLFLREIGEMVGGWIGHVDVVEENVGSRRIVEGLGGKMGWRVWWLRVDLEGSDRLT